MERPKKVFSIFFSPSCFLQFRFIVEFVFALFPFPSSQAASNQHPAVAWKKKKKERRQKRNRCSLCSFPHTALAKERNGNDSLAERPTTGAIHSPLKMIVFFFVSSYFWFHWRIVCMWGWGWGIWYKSAGCQCYIARASTTISPTTDLHSLA